MDQARFPQASFALCGLFGQDVVRKRLAANDLSRTRGLEPFGCATVGFHFWHDDLLNELKKDKTTLPPARDLYPGGLG
jgi:hypothetical protein